MSLENVPKPVEKSDEIGKKNSLEKGPAKAAEETSINAKTQAELYKGMEARSTLVNQLSPEQDKYKNLEVNLNDFLKLGPDLALQILTGMKVNEDPEIGQEILFSFKNKKTGQVNEELEHGIGLKILSPKIRALTLIKSNGTQIYGVRKGYMGSFFDANGKYVAVLDGDKVRFEAPPASTPSFQELTKQRNEAVKNWENNANFSKDGENLAVKQDERTTIIKKCVDAENFDPYLLLAIRQVNNGHYGHQNEQGFEAEIELAIKYLQAALIRYEKETNEKSMSANGSYTPQCIAYLLSHYNLFADETFLDTTKLNMILKAYQKLKNLSAEYSEYVIPTNQIAKPVEEYRASFLGTQGSDSNGRKAKVSFKPQEIFHYSEPQNIEIKNNGEPTAAGREILAKTVPYEKWIQKYSKLNGIPEELTRAIGLQETGWDPKRTSWAGAMGLMQLMPDTARHFGATDPYDPEQNIKAGTAFLGYLWRKFPNRPDLVILAYNGGEGIFKKKYSIENIKTFANSGSFIDLEGRIAEIEGKIAELKIEIKNTTDPKQKKELQTEKDKLSRSLENPKYGRDVKRHLANLGYDVSSINYGRLRPKVSTSKPFLVA